MHQWPRVLRPNATRTLADAGEESAEGIEGPGEAASSGQRTCGEKAGRHYSALHASFGAGPSSSASSPSPNVQGGAGSAS